MKTSIWVVLCIGAFAVLQAGLNRRIGAQSDLFRATVLNGITFLAVATVVWRVAVHFELTSSGPLFNVEAIRWWWILPGFLGCSLVIGLPFAISRIGALKTFVVLVAAQILFGAVWDRIVEQSTITPVRIAAAGLAIGAAALSAFSK